MAFHLELVIHFMEFIKGATISFCFKYIKQYHYVYMQCLILFSFITLQASGNSAGPM